MPTRPLAAPRRRPAALDLAALGLALAAAWPGAAHADILIDDFSVGPFELVVDQAVGSPTKVILDSPTINDGELTFPIGPVTGFISGERTAIFRSTTIDQPGLDRARARVFTDGVSVLDVQHSVGAASVFELQYSEEILLSPAPPPAPVLPAGHDRIDLDFLGFDSPDGQPLRIELRLTLIESLPPLADPPGSVFLREDSLVAELTDTGPGTLSFDLSGFDSDLLASASTLTIRFTSPAGADFRLDAIRAVPEPASLTLLALGAAALGLSRRPRRR